MAGRLFSLFRVLFLENFQLKVFSLLIGFTVWYFVSGEQDIDKIIEVPVEMIHKPPQLEVSNRSVTTVQVQVVAPQFQKDILAKGITATLDLTGAQRGENVFLLTQDRNFKLPPGVRLFNIRPPTITVELEPSANRVVPVKIRTIGQLAANHLLLEKKSIPGEVTISGPANHVEKVKEVFTQTISIDGLSTYLQLNASLVCDDPFVTIVSGNVVQTLIFVQEKTVRRVLRGLPVQLEKAVAGLSLVDRTADLDAQVPLSALERFSAEQVILFVDGTSPSSGSGKEPGALPIQVRGLPEVVKEIKLTPPRARIRLRVPK